MTFIGPVQCCGAQSPASQGMRPCTTLLAALLLLPISTAADVVSEAWAAACSMLTDQHGLTCDDIAPPRIEFRSDPEAPLGEYAGGNRIYVDKALKGINRDWILVHEMTHYIFSALSIFPLPSDRYVACKSEALAFAASNAYLTRRGYGRQTKSDWLDAYPHCAWMRTAARQLNSPSARSPPGRASGRGA